MKGESKKKNKIPASARTLLPLNWWDHHMDFYLEVIHNFKIGAVVDLFGFGKPGEGVCLLDTATAVPVPLSELVPRIGVVSSGRHVYCARDGPCGPAAVEVLRRRDEGRRCGALAAP